MSPGIEIEEVQALLVHGYPKLDHAELLRMQVIDPASEDGQAKARKGLEQLQASVTWGLPESLDTPVNIAFTAHGLAHLGLDSEIRDSFPAAFLEGMHERHKFLGDQPADWKWGNAAALPDAILLVFGKDAGRTKEQSERLQRESVGWAFAPLPEAHALLAPGQVGGGKARREHFGFVDGIGNPTIRGLKRGRPENEVALGEFVLGYPNEYGRLPPSPTVDPGGGKGVVLANGDFGRNGSYLVFRQLSQEVHRFWSFLLEQCGDREGRASRAIALAAKIVGRWPNGAPLARWSAYEPDGDRGKDDDFLYGADPEGFGCPIGSHIRRTNPRDSVPQLDAERSIASTKHRRLLRRGRTYGPPVKAWLERAAAGRPWPDPEAIVAAGDDQVDRGIHFLCFCANLVDQYEFVQQSWVNSPKFGGLSNDPDPLLCGSGFTIQARPVNRRIDGLPAFVTMKGGAYFFMPSKRALRYLTQL
jgi:Dyp-type peroxidase family